MSNKKIAIAMYENSDVKDKSLHELVDEYGEKPSQKVLEDIVKVATDIYCQNITLSDMFKNNIDALGEITNLNLEIISTYESKLNKEDIMVLNAMAEVIGSGSGFLRKLAIMALVETYPHVTSADILERVIAFKLSEMYPNFDTSKFRVKDIETEDARGFGVALDKDYFDVHGSSEISDYIQDLVGELLHKTVQARVMSTFDNDEPGSELLN